MFEREIKDTAFIPRWSIVRKLRDQNIAEHSFFVAMHTNDLCVYLGLDRVTHLRALQYALWHDIDEIFSGDMPGPNKREFVTDKAGMKSWLAGAMDKVFALFELRGGSWCKDDHEMVLIKAVVKVADWIESATEAACEIQLGNRNMAVHYLNDSKQCYEALNEMFKLFNGQGVDLFGIDQKTELRRIIRYSFENHLHGQSVNSTYAEEMGDAVSRRRGFLTDLGLKTPFA